MYRTGQVVAELDISPGALRRLSDRFAPWLSGAAGNPDVLDNGRRATRLYSDEDVRLLAEIQRWKGEGLSDDEVETRLAARQREGSAPLAIVEAADAPMMVQGAAALGQALRQLDETQQALVLAQQANRELLNAVIGDAVALKDENDRLRRRLRVMEEEMARLKESDWNHRTSLEERLSQLERDPSRRSWWDRLRGR